MCTPSTGPARPWRSESIETGDSTLVNFFYCPLPGNTGLIKNLFHKDPQKPGLRRIPSWIRIRYYFWLWPGGIFFFFLLVKSVWPTLDHGTQRQNWIRLSTHTAPSWRVKKSAFSIAVYTIFFKYSMATFIARNSWYNFSTDSRTM